MDTIKVIFKIDIGSIITMINKGSFFKHYKRIRKYYYNNNENLIVIEKEDLLQIITLNYSNYYYDGFRQYDEYDL